MRWIMLDCRPKGLERLSIVDQDTNKVVCRLENSVSGRPIEQDDLDHAALIISAPELQERMKALEADLEAAAGELLVPIHEPGSSSYDALK
mgnify:CR=1 FL=1